MAFHFKDTAIAAFGLSLPEEVWTSESIEARLQPLYERLKLPQGRLELMTGIRERRFWPADTLPSTVAAQAGQAAMKNAQTDPEAIDLLIHSSVCRDQLEPATASTVHVHLGLSPKAQVMDVSNACLGFCNAMVLAAGLLESGQIETALIVSGENGRPLMDSTLQALLKPEQTRKSLKPYFANLTIGAGAVAAVLTRKSKVTGAGAVALLGGASLTDSSANPLCKGGTGGAGGLQMQTDSEALLHAGVALAERTWEAFTKATGWQASDLDRVICHQVGKQHQRALLQRLGIPLELDYVTYPWLGNVGSVSLPITLFDALAKGAIQPGDRVAGLGIGSGLCCMMLAFEALHPKQQGHCY
jgi:3-oxoacyl-[acyl-carrier-protein] synthase-3